jgi:hypothetical protein
MPGAERDDPLLDHHRELVGHLRTPALPGPEHLQPRLLNPTTSSGNRCVMRLCSIHFGRGGATMSRNTDGPDTLGAVLL